MENILYSFNLSYSTYHTYKESELMFYFNKILKPEPTDWVPNGYGIAGNIVHECCEEKIKNKDFDVEEKFMSDWFVKRMSEQKGLYNTTFNKNKYLCMLNLAIRFINSITDIKESIPELHIEFKMPELDNMVVKGYIDWVVVTNDNNVYFYDWKTNSTSSQEMHELQRLFYSWLYWKKYGVIAKKCTWVYLSKFKTFSNSFSLEEIKYFEKKLIKDIIDIKNKGTNISNYEIGKIDSPFNSYKTLCIKEKERRKNKIKFGIAVYGHRCVLVGDISELLIQGLDKILSYEKKDSKFIKRNSEWDGVIHLFRKSDNSFPTGYLNEVKKVLIQYSKYMKKELSLEYKDMRKKIPTFDIPLKFEDIKLRSYQQQAEDSFLEKKYGVVKLKTGLGKTIVAGSIIKQINLTTLWVIDRKILVEQTKKVFEELFNEEIGTITEGKVNIQRITICTYQTLVKRFDILNNYLKNEVGVLVVDECHKASSNSIKQISDKCINTQYRLGLSATPNNDKEKWFEVKGIIGDICFELDKDDDRNKLFLTEANITFLELDDKKFADNGEYLEAYNSYIVNNEIRNNKIKELVELNKDKNILIITKSLEHARILKNMLNCDILIGETTAKEREYITEMYNSEKPFLCVGSVQIISEGWDVPSLEVVIQASGISGCIKTIQGLGRGLRKHKEKKEALYYDFLDKHSKFARKSALNRINALKYEGNKIKIEK